MATLKVHSSPQRNEGSTVIKLDYTYIETLDMAKIRFGENAVVNHSPRGYRSFTVTRIENGNFIYKEEEGKVYTKETFERICKTNNLDSMGERDQNKELSKNANYQII